MYKFFIIHFSTFFHKRCNNETFKRCPANQGSPLSSVFFAPVTTNVAGEPRCLCLVSPGFQWENCCCARLTRRLSPPAGFCYEILRIRPHRNTGSTKHGRQTARQNSVSSFQQNSSLKCREPSHLAAQKFGTCVSQAK